MLDELKNLNYFGGKEGLLFFLCDVIGSRVINIRDAKVLCAHAPGKRYLSVGDLSSYCLSFGWIKEEDDAFSISPALISILQDKEKLNEELISTTINQLFSDGILNPSMFSYDSVQSCYTFKNELFPLSLSSVRNVLISQGFLVPYKDSKELRFLISPTYNSLIAKRCIIRRKQLSIENLKKIIEENEIAGEKAELFVLSFEKARIGHPLCESINRISEIDASAGYDIVSYDSPQSLTLDRFIEVKALSSNGFFWSKNEYEIAKLKGDMYYLYLVDLGRIGESGYVPEIIQDPATNVMKADQWFVEAQSYHIKHI